MTPRPPDYKQEPVNNILLSTSNSHGMVFEVFTRYSNDFRIIPFLIRILTHASLSSKRMLPPGLVTSHCMLYGQMFLQPQTVPHSGHTLSQLQKLLLRLAHVYTEHTNT